MLEYFKTGWRMRVVHVLWEHVDWVRLPAARLFFGKGRLAIGLLLVFKQATLEKSTKRC